MRHENKINSKLFNILDSIRIELKKSSDPISDFCLIHAGILQEVIRSDESEWSKALWQQVEEFKKEPSRKKHILLSESEPCIIVSFFTFDSTNIQLEYIHYENINVDYDIFSKFDSAAMPVNILRCSDGLRSERIVAIFPENWIYHLKYGIEKSDNVIYFIDRFVNRFNKFSIPLINIGTSKDSFMNIKNIINSEYANSLIQELSVLWMWIHENSHHKGGFPLPEFLEQKNSRTSGAVEEMRADVLGILQILDSDWIPENQRKNISEFIISERLLRYPIECLYRGDSLNYDAIGSQIIFNFLLNSNYIEIENNILRINADWDQGLKSYMREIDNIESYLRVNSFENPKIYVSKFAKKWGNYDFRSKKFTFIKFYEDLFKRISFDD